MRPLKSAFSLLALLVLLSVGLQAQDREDAPAEAKDETLSFSDIQSGALRQAKHYVSEKKAVHTYRMKTVSPKEVADEEEEGMVPGNVSPLLDRLRRSEGVQRTSFDAATATITVVTAHETELPQHLTAE